MSSKEILSRDEFIDWYQEFVKKFSGIKVAAGHFYDEVEKSHEKIREKIGGVRKIVPVDLEDIQLPIPLNEVEPLLNELTKKINGYFSQYKFTFNDMCFPVIQKGDFKGMKWGKHIQHWMRNQKLDKAAAEEVNRIVSRLGGYWSKCKTQKDMLYANITTDPRAFCQIGHYGPDFGSCFRQGSSNQKHKYILGSNNNSYVLLVSKNGGIEQYSEKTSSDEFHKHDIHCRMWGSAVDSYNAYCCGNYYLGRKDVVEGNVVKAIDKVFASLLGVNKCKKHEGLFKVTNVYQNSGHNWTYTAPDWKSGSDNMSFIFSVKKFLTDMVQCINCSTLFMKGDTGTFIDTRSGYNWCVDCTAKLPRCGWSNEIYVGNGYDARNRNNVSIKISPDVIASGTFLQCRWDGLYYHKDDMVISSIGYRYNKWYAEAKSYSKCSTCHCHDPVDRMSVVDGKGYCVICFDKIKKEKAKKERSMPDKTMFGNTYTYDYDKESYVIVGKQRKDRV